jgi:hypothetical protein
VSPALDSFQLPSIDNVLGRLPALDVGSELKVITILCGIEPEPKGKTIPDTPIAKWSIFHLKSALTVFVEVICLVPKL